MRGLVGQGAGDPSPTASGWPGPVRSPIGRYVVAGWRADTFVAGTPNRGTIEVVSASVRLHEATANLERPRFSPAAGGAGRMSTCSSPPTGRPGRTGCCSAAGRRAGLARLGRRTEVGGADQSATPYASPPAVPVGWCTVTVRHRALRRCRMPGITDITPYRRPAARRSASSSWTRWPGGDADDGLLERWSPLPEWPQMVLRALMFRLAVHVHCTRGPPRPPSRAWRTAALVRLSAVACVPVRAFTGAQGAGSLHFAPWSPCRRSARCFRAASFRREPPAMQMI